jgi:glutamate racemase
MNMTKIGPIGVFDSGYGGLTILKEFVKLLPQYDYLYLGDNARAPYGMRSYETVYHYTLECVKHLFAQGCHLVILACNTASAKALRTIQHNDLPFMDPSRRVLGIIRPTSEVIGLYSQSGHVGILGTSGTINSQSYKLEIEKFFPELKVFQEACPMWVPLVENNEHTGMGADFFIKKNLDNLLFRSQDIDTILLACTHYPLLINKIKQVLPEKITILSQGFIVAKSLKDYLERHPEIAATCSRKGQRTFYTTDATEIFDIQASAFFGQEISSLNLV